MRRHKTFFRATLTDAPELRYFRRMGPQERDELQAEQGKMRRRHDAPEPLPWASLAEVAQEAKGSSFEWTEEIEDAFLQLIAEGYTVHEITRQGRPGWPTYADYRAKIGQDPEFINKIALQEFSHAASCSERALTTASNSLESNHKSSKLKVDVLLRRAAAFDPKRFGQSQRTELSGSLVLAAGSLADLAAAAAARAIPCASSDTKAIEGDTLRTIDAPSSPDNLPSSDSPQSLQGLAGGGDVA